MKTARIVTGLLVWAAIAVGGGWWLFGRGEDSPACDEVVLPIWDFVSGQRRVARLEVSDSCYLQKGDPIFVVEGEDQVRQVGEISAVPLNDSDATSQATFYASAPEIRVGTRLVYHRTPGSMEWVLKTMLPPDKRQAIMTELAQAYHSHRAEIIQVLRPVAEASLKDALAVVEQDLPPALAARREEFQSLGAKYQNEIVEKDLVPVVREEVWPVVRKHAEPTVMEVGQEVWNRVSLWEFAWRYLYDRSGLPKQDLTKKEFQRFLDDEAIPILESHTDEFVAVQQKILAEVARNPKVQAAVKASVGEVLSDPAAQRIFWEVMQQVIIENPRMKAVLDEHWRSPQVQQAFQLTAARLEPTAVRVGELLLGTPETGVTPEFARVLRNQVLGKDRRWLVLENSAAPAEAAEQKPLTLRVERGRGEAVYPFVREGV